MFLIQEPELDVPEVPLEEREVNKIRVGAMKTDFVTAKTQHQTSQAVAAGLLRPQSGNKLELDPGSGVLPAVTIGQTSPSAPGTGQLEETVPAGVIAEDCKVISTPCVKTAATPRGKRARDGSPKEKLTSKKVKAEEILGGHLTEVEHRGVKISPRGHTNSAPLNSADVLFSKPTSLVPAQEKTARAGIAVPEAVCRLAAWGLPDTILAQYAEKGITTMFPWQVSVSYLASMHVTTLKLNYKSKMSLLLCRVFF